MSEELQSLRESLMEGIRKSKQGSLDRRSPAKASVKFFAAAKSGLREYVRRNEASSEAWHLLSQTEECLLNYREAILCLEKAMSLSKDRSRKDLKKLALLKECFGEWNELALTPKELKSLGEYLLECGAAQERNGRTLDYTTKWLEKHGIPFPEKVLEALSNQGGYTDFTILYNVVKSC